MGNATPCLHPHQRYNMVLTSKKSKSPTPLPQTAPRRQGTDDHTPAPTLLRQGLADPRRASPAIILALQRTYGNQVVQRLVLPLGALAPGVEKNEKNEDASIIREKTDNITRATGKSNIQQGHKEVDMRKPQPLSELDSQETLYIVAHGGGMQVDQYGPEGLAKHLIELGLPDTYHGMIELVACRSGEKEDGKTTFAQKFYKALYKRGIMASVKGLDGIGKIFGDPESIRVMSVANSSDFKNQHAALWKPYKEMKREAKALEALIPQLKQEIADKDSAISALQAARTAQAQDQREPFVEFKQKRTKIEQEKERLQADLKLLKGRAKELSPQMQMELATIAEPQNKLIDQYHFPIGKGVLEIKPDKKQEKKWNKTVSKDIKKKKERNTLREAYIKKVQQG